MAKKKAISVASYNDKEYEQFAENITRVRYMKYFKGTKPAFKERESTGILSGAFLSLTIGCLAVPYLLRIGSDFSTKTILGLTIVMAATTVVLGIWGFMKMAKERRRIYRPVSDEEFDRYLAFDLKGLTTRARMLVTDKTPHLKEGKDSIEDVEPVILYSPEEYSSNTNLPLLIKRGDDGKVRFSNLYTMVLFPTKQGMYLNITYLNLCDGSAKFDRIYACPYTELEEVTFKRRKYAMTSQAGRSEIHDVKSFLIISKTGDTREAGVDVIDYDILKDYGGHFDDTPVKLAAMRLNKFVPEKVHIKVHDDLLPPSEE